MDFKLADSLYKLKLNGKYIDVIETSSGKKIGRIFLEGVYLNNLVKSKYRFVGLKDYINSLDKLSSRVPVQNFEMLYGKEFSNSAKTVNLIREKLVNVNNGLANKLDNILNSIKLEIKSVNKSKNGYFKVYFCLKYKGRQWTNFNYLPNSNVNLILLLSSLFFNGSISNDMFDNFVSKNTNNSYEDCQLIWKRSFLIKEKLMKLFDNDFKEIESLLIRYSN